LELLFFNSKLFLTKFSDDFYFNSSFLDIIPPGFSLSFPTSSLTLNVLWSSTKTNQIKKEVTNKNKQKINYSDNNSNTNDKFCNKIVDHNTFKVNEEVGKESEKPGGIISRNDELK
jgi:hypothetical protein